MKRIRVAWLIAALIGVMLPASLIAEPLTAPSAALFTADEAAKFYRQSRGVLAPVYPAMAEHLTARYNLAEKEGIGIDLGSGPGALIIELCKRTKSLYWINADINPFNFPYFYAEAAQTRVAHRVGAVFADAHAMPFKDNYADIVVSRGTFQFWEDQQTAFKEIYRILKPGGVAFIGRGYTENLPAAVAAEIRRVQGDGGPKYDVAETAAALTAVMKALGITDFQVIVPKAPNSDVKYGIWLEFTKPLVAKTAK